MKKDFAIKSPLHTSSLVLLFTLLSMGCNNSGKSNPSTDTVVNRDTTTIKSGPVMDADSTYDDDSLAFTTVDFKATKLYVLKMTKQQFIDLFKVKNGHKMIKFRFERKDDGWSMYAYPTNKNARRTNLDRIHLEIATKSHFIDFTEDDTKYKEIISRGQIKKYLNLPLGNDEVIDENKFEEVWLTPCRRVLDNKIIFIITKPGQVPSCPKIKREGGGDLNPSPPDNPCLEYGCDGAAKTFK